MSGLSDRCEYTQQTTVKFFCKIEFDKAYLSYRHDEYASVAQLVEHYLAKVDVESSNLFARSIFGRISLLFHLGFTLDLIYYAKRARYSRMHRSKG